MRFLLDANMPKSTLAALQQLGHQAIDVRDIGMGGAADVDIAAYAKVHHLVLLTRDLDFSDVRNYPPAEYAGIVVLELPDDAVAQTVVKVLASFVAQSELLAKVPGRLAIVEPWRVRFRPGLA
jgi:predicted nuclease of predicted toxin-antitoxin system